jgi:hypothetical protein
VEAEVEDPRDDEAEGIDQDGKDRSPGQEQQGTDARPGEHDEVVDGPVERVGRGQVVLGNDLGDEGGDGRVGDRPHHAGQGGEAESDHHGTLPEHEYRQGDLEQREDRVEHDEEPGTLEALGEQPAVRAHEHRGHEARKGDGGDPHERVRALEDEDGQRDRVAPRAGSRDGVAEEQPAEVGRA